MVAPANREPADAVQAHALANHWRATDPHPQYLLRTEQTEAPVVPQASNTAAETLVLGSLASSAGSSDEFARADHVHRIDSAAFEAALAAQLATIEASVLAAANFQARQYAWSVAS